MANETKEEYERGKVFDAIYTNGAMDYDDLSLLTRIPHRRVVYLCDHEWFTRMHGLVYLATYCDGRFGVAIAQAGSFAHVSKRNKKR